MPLETADINSSFLSIKCNSIRLSGLAHGTLTKTVHKTLPGGGGGQGGGGLGMVGVRGWWGSGVVKVRGSRGRGSRCGGVSGLGGGDGMGFF